MIGERWFDEESAGSDETIAVFGVVGCDSDPEFVADVLSASSVDPVPLRLRVRRWLVPVFAMVAVLPEEREDDAACDVPYQEQAVAVSSPSSLERNVDAEEDLRPSDLAVECRSPLSEHEVPEFVAVLAGPEEVLVRLKLAAAVRAVSAIRVDVVVSPEEVVCRQDTPPDAQRHVEYAWVDGLAQSLCVVE